MPVSWEGWAIDLGIVAVLLGGGPWVRTTQHIFLALSFVFVPLLLRAAVAHWKGEPDDWR
jgi:hypothetical protein